MNNGFPPLLLADPEIRPRRKEQGRTAPLPIEVLERRHEIARVLKVKINGLSRRLRAMTEDERKAVFYKLEHDMPVTDPATTLSGTDLKPVAQPTPETIYAVPRKENLNNLSKKLDEFDTTPVKKQHVPNEWLAHLTDIREADPKDRLSDDLRKQYSTLVKANSLLCEIEFLSLLRGPKQQKEEIGAWIRDLVTDFQHGANGNCFEHELSLPTCRAVIRCTGSMFKQLVETSKWVQRIRCIESRPRFQTFQEITQRFRVQDLAPLVPPARDAPVICIVDSGVTAGNPFLEKCVRPGLSKSFLKQRLDNPNDEHGHGSAVASLAAYHGLNLAPGATNTPRVWIASARILNADNQIEDERLFSKVLEDVVQHFAKKNIRIFCLAVGDDRRIWGESTRKSVPRKSWVARRIDQLSREYNVVFVTCTGNLDLRTIREFYRQGKPFPEYFAEDDAQLLDPAQASLALTVGSIAHSTNVVAATDYSAIALKNQPSPFTRCGPGIRREIKPEVVEYGGNLASDGALGTIRENRGLQVVAASKSLSPAVSYWTGTSFAAPRVVHRLALIDYDLRSLGITPSASLLRAFLVNSARRREDNGELVPILDVFSAKKHRDRVDLLLGHGLPDHTRATGCDDFSVIAYHQGDIEPDNVVFFDMPVPAELADQGGRRRLTVTVVHAPEVQRWGLERYFGADLKWRMFRGDKKRDEIVDAMSESTDESDEETLADLLLVDEEEALLPKELSFHPSVIKRSRGTIQHAVFEWGKHQRQYSDRHYTLAIAAYKRWQRKVSPIPFAVVVRLEDLGRRVEIYSRVRIGLEVEV